MHSYTFVCICMHSHACSLLRNIQPNFEYLVLCSDGQPHTVAVTALFITDAQCVPGRRSFDRYDLETLIEKVAGVTRRAHRPRNIVAGTRIQPTDDTVEEEGDGEESEDEDLDDM